MDAIESNETLKNWFKVKRGANVLPFKFKSSHPRSFHSLDFGIWAAFCPDQARLFFSKVLVDCFESSWKELSYITGEKIGSDMADFSKSIESYPWLKQEFSLWGSIFSSLWVYPDQNEAPLIYRLIPKYFQEWNISEPWFCGDGFTPRVYRFEELALQGKSLYFADENDGYLDEGLITEVRPPIIGSQYLEDSSSLLLLLQGFGFNDKGEISYKGVLHDQYSVQILK